MSHALQHSLELFFNAHKEKEQVIDYLVATIFPSGVSCPKCKGETNQLTTRPGIIFCPKCKRQFGLFQGTPFADRMGIRKWGAVFYMLLPYAYSSISRTLERCQIS